MKLRENKIKVMLGVLILILLFLITRKIELRKRGYHDSETITVIGEAKLIQKNQVAIFNAGVDSVQDDKNKAVKEVNQKIKKLIEDIKKFGVDENEIKTQDLSIYQQQEVFYEDGVRRTQKGQWRVHNSIEIRLRQVEKTDELVSLLTSSEVDNVYGPNFSFEDTSDVKKELFETAMKDAKVKAVMLAKASDREVGKIVNVIEGDNYSSSPYSVVKMADGVVDGRPSVEVGSGMVSQSLTVVFELK